MSLHINDMILLSDSKTGQSLYRVQQLSIVDDSLDLLFRLHTASKIDDHNEMRRVRSWEKMKLLQPQKVTVDPLGQIHPCND